jgi:hypothetical protein
MEYYLRLFEVTLGVIGMTAITLFLSLVMIQTWKKMWGHRYDWWDFVGYVWWKRGFSKEETVKRLRRYADIIEEQLKSDAKKGTQQETR